MGHGPRVQQSQETTTDGTDGDSGSAAHFADVSGMSHLRDTEKFEYSIKQIL